uniref:Usp domain-containing protein n=1 Tax=Macrostomum lignano TaxID=282301 RepID=A0A1I8GT58_9PLAT
MSGRKILIPLDGSQHAEAAYQWYLDNIRRDGDSLVIAHILEPPSLPSFSLKSGFNMEFVAEPSKRPGEALVDIAWRTGCNMVVMGTRGLGDVKRAFLGSVSDYVLHNSRLAVTIVPVKLRDSQGERRPSQTGGADA